MHDGIPAVASAPTGTRARAGWLALAIVAATFAAYVPALRAGWIWDDDDYVTRNEVLEDPGGWRRVWIPGETPQYYPLVFTSFWVERRLWGLDPTGYHAVNIALHALSALLVVGIFRRLRVPGAWMIGALFALHPVHVESVAWVTERKNVLSGCFYLLSAHAWFSFEGVPLRRFRRGVGGPCEQGGGDARGRGAGWWLVSFLLFLAALCSKTVTASLPVALGLARAWRRERIGVRTVLALLPFLLAGAALGLHTAFLEHTVVGAQGAAFDRSFADRLVVAGRAFLFYPAKILLPSPLVFLYPRWTMDPGQLVAWLPLGGCLALAAASVWLWRRGRRGPGLALAFYGVTIFPALGFVDVYPLRFSFVADHFQYLASLGVLAAGVGWLAARVPASLMRTIVASFVLVTCGLLTGSQAGIYRDRGTLWEETARHNPDSWMVQESLGVIHRQRALAARRGGREDEAARELAISEGFLRSAHEKEPSYGLNAWNLGETLRLQGNDLEAARWFDEASTRDSSSLVFAIAAWRGWIVAGRAEDAEPFARRVLDLSTVAQPDVRLWLAKRRLRAGDIVGGEAAIRRNLAESPGHIPSHVALAELAAQAGDERLAARQLRAALRAAPKDRPPVLALRSLGLLLATSHDATVRDAPQAVALLEPLARVTARRDPLVLDSLAAAYAGVGRLEEAVATARQALALARASRRGVDAAKIRERLASYEARLETPGESGGPRRDP